MSHKHDDTWVCYLCEEETGQLSNGYNNKGIMDRPVNSNHIILISGNKRAGKNHAASIVENLVESSTLYSAASPVKDMVAASMSVTPEELNKYKNNPGVITISTEVEGEGRVNTTNYRDVIRYFAESAKDVFGKEVWANLLATRIRKGKAETSVVTDFRFVEELEAIKNVSSFNTSVHTIKVLGGEPDYHASEQPIDIEYDYVIDNIGHSNTIEEELTNILHDIGIKLKGHNK